MTRMMVVLGLLLWPTAAQACSVCFSATDGNRMAFLITTVVLSLLPLGLIGGGILYLRHRFRQVEHEERERFGAATETPIAANPETSQASG